jgi:hypothetical protein
MISIPRIGQEVIVDFMSYKPGMGGPTWFVPALATIPGKSPADVIVPTYSYQAEVVPKFWNYCVQYRESDFNFASRLMEQEGIFYRYEMENTLISSWNISGHGGDTGSRPMESISMNFTSIPYAQARAAQQGYQWVSVKRDAAGWELAYAKEFWEWVAGQLFDC